MNARIFQLDAFASERFAGNPAAVVPVGAFPPDAVMQAIAAENNLSETAFLVADGDDWRIRWFTPTVEVPLCGHATLASAAVVMERLAPGRRRVVFQSKSGPLPVQSRGDGYVMDFPARPVSPAEDTPELRAALRVTPVEVLTDTGNFIARVANAEVVRTLRPDLAAVVRLPRTGLIVTADGDD